MLDKLATEARNQSTMDLDQLSVLEVLKKINTEDEKASNVIKSELTNIEKATKSVIESFKNNGRLIYVGAGNSGRLAVLDAVECVPTFSVPEEMVQGIVAGGLNAFVSAAESSEDSLQNGEKDLEKLHVTENDTVIGISASGRTPYVIGALEHANIMHSNTVSISCNKKSKMSDYADISIELETGPEILTGSTRLKAGTTQKMVLNMISTTAMVGIGKVYQNLMVDLKPTNYKLEERSKRIIMEATEVEYEKASQYYILSDYQVKKAIVMIILNCSKSRADEMIEKSNGFVKDALSFA